MMQRDFSNFSEQMIRSQIGDLTRTEEAAKRLAESVKNERLLLEEELSRRNLL